MTATAAVRFLATGTRVVLLAGGAPRAGVVQEVRQQPHFKTYVVACDDGSIAYASAYEIAREDDPQRAPVGLRAEF